MMEKTIAQKNEKMFRRMRIPVSGILELTPRCNLDCKMCYVHLTREQMGDRKELSTRQWIDVIDQAVEEGLLRVLLTGGECMLHEGFWEIYEHLREKGVMVSVNTNGLLITDEVIRRFQKLPPNSLRITVYGGDEDSYEQVTGHRVCERVLANIRKLVAAGIHPRLAQTICRQNADQALKVFDLARELSLRSSYDLELAEPEEETGRNLDNLSLSSEEIVDKLRQFKEYWGGKPMFFEPLDWTPELLPDEPDYRGMVCAAGQSQFAVRWDGSFTACFDLPIVGKVQDIGFHAAWEAATRMVREYRVPVECRDCKIRGFCSPCVILRQDSNNPGHCNLNVCRRTILKYNKGIGPIDPNTDLAAFAVSSKCPE